MGWGDNMSKEQGCPFQTWTKLCKNDATLCLTSGMHGIKAFPQFLFCSKMQTQRMFPSKKMCERGMGWD